MKPIKRIIVGAGHGKERYGIYTTKGKRGPDGWPEGNFNRRFANRFCEIAEQRGFETVNICGDSVADISLKTRVITEKLFANDESMFLSCHVNAKTNNGWQDDARGARVLYYSAKTLAQSIAKSLNATSGKVGFKAVIRQLKYLYMLKKTASQAILLETAFMDNKEDRDHLESHVDQMCHLVLDGIEDHNKGIIS